MSASDTGRRPVKRPHGFPWRGRHPPARRRGRMAAASAIARTNRGAHRTLLTANDAKRLRYPTMEMNRKFRNTCLLAVRDSWNTDRYIREAANHRRVR